MAFKSNSPISVVFPPFRGVTRRIILIALCTYLGLAVDQVVLHRAWRTLYSPCSCCGRTRRCILLIWQLVTYPFVGEGLISVAFALLSIWFFGSALEDERGSRWMTEYFLVATIGGGVDCVAAEHGRGRTYSRVSGRRIWTVGLWPAVLAVMVAYGRIHAEDQVQFNFLFTIKAKYIAVIYVLFYLGLALVGGDRFGALTALCNAGVGYGFLLAGAASGVSDWRVREVVCAAELVLPCEAASRGEEVYGVHAEAG